MPHHVVFEKSQDSLQETGQLPFLCLWHSLVLEPNPVKEETAAWEDIFILGTERQTGDKDIRKRTRRGTSSTFTWSHNRKLIDSN